jgi:hypothetical protein
LSILFLYGYLAPIGLPNSLLGSQYSSLVSSAGYSSLIPGGVVGILLLGVLARIGTVARAATAPSSTSPEELMRRMNFPSMAGAQSAAAAALPADMTRSQFAVLRSYRQGYRKSKDISRALSMDKGEVEKEAETLKKNGYLTGENKLTSKAMELLGS